MQLPNSEFLKRMRALLGESDYKAYLDSLELPHLRFARKNPLKPVDDALILGETGRYPLIAPDAKPGNGALHAAGAYYVQEPAAAAVAMLLPPLLPENAKVLDMCAAPGGKATATASYRPDCTILANEVVFSRAKILLSNTERLGLRNCTVTSLPAHEISRRGAIFDAVIADVPCSGEGMLRKTEFGSEDLSDEAVESCAARARKILDECDKCLKGGGILLFSTCTFNLKENEEQALRLIKEKGYEPLEPIARPEHSRRGYDLPQAVRFFPQDGGGEGHFACLLRKPNDGDASFVRRKNKTQNELPSGKRLKSMQEVLGNITREDFSKTRLIAVGDGCELLPPDYPFADFPALRRGMRLVDFSGERAIPHHHFATAANPEFLIASPNYSPDSPEIKTYLSGGEFACDAQNGFRILRTAGITLGLIKVSSGTAKNHYPKGCRIMTI